MPTVSTIRPIHIIKHFRPLLDNRPLFVTCNLFPLKNYKNNQFIIVILVKYSGMFNYFYIQFLLKKYQYFLNNSVSIALYVLLITQLDFFKDFCIFL